MIERNKRRQDYYMRSEIKKEVGEGATVDELLIYLIGDSDGHYSDYAVFKYTSTKRTLFNRINLIWFMPVYLTSIPFQWLMYGDIGVKRTSKIGKFVDWLVRL